MESSKNNPTDPTHLCKTPLECVEYYNQWAGKYDTDVVDIEYNGANLLVEVCLEFLNNKNAKILDFLCGTGTVGRKLSEYGYKHIDGIDGSSNMLDICQKTGAYENVYKEILSAETSSEMLPKCFYDVLVCVGVFSPGHINSDYFNHLYEPVKVIVSSKIST